MDECIELDDGQYLLEDIKPSSSKSGDELFYKKLNYAIKNEVECLLFFSLDNQGYDSDINENIKPVKHIYEEVGSHIAELFSEGEHINTTNFLQATRENPLPNTELCKAYTKKRQEVINKQNNEKIAMYLELGREVAYRNGYKEDCSLTAINSSSTAIRKIFKNNRMNGWYLSIDVENGAFETFDAKGRHMGAYTYEGIVQDCEDNRGTHDIRIKK